MQTICGNVDEIYSVYRDFIRDVMDLEMCHMSSSLCGICEIFSGKQYRTVELKCFQRYEKGNGFQESYCVLTYQK